MADFIFQGVKNYMVNLKNCIFLRVLTIANVDCEYKYKKDVILT